MGFVIKVLHLCAGYPHTNLYKELVENLDRIDIEQNVYIPVKRREDLNKKIIGNLKNTSLIYSKSFNNTDRLFYAHKVNKILYDIKNKVNFKSFNLVHTHFLFSMGGIALKLKKEKNIDYIVAIRNTDVNLFFKYIFYLKEIGIQIMKEAKKIICESYTWSKNTQRLIKIYNETI